MLRKGLFLLAALLLAAVPARAQQPGGCTKIWAAVSEQALSNVAQNHTRLLRQVRVDCNDIQLFADEAEIFSDADRVRASGNVLFISSTNRISADRMEFNTRTKTGTFFNASGIASMEGRSGVEQSLFGTQEPDAFFYGETIEKLGPKTYRIRKGGFTTCVQPTPRWEFISNDVTLTLEKHAFIKNAVLKVKDVPVFYMPAMYYPINKEDRATGFLMPIYGRSTIKGQTLDNAFFWAINRSQDATFYHSWFSKTGQSIAGEYRYAQSPTSSGNIRTVYVNEHDATYDQPDGSQQVVPGIDNYTINGQVVQQLPGKVRLSGRAAYFSSLIGQQRYQQDIVAATNRNRMFNVNAVKSWRGDTLSATADRTETFTTDTESQVFGTFPRILFSHAEQKLGPLPLYAGTGVEYVTFIRHSAGTPEAQSFDSGLSRFDVFPGLRFPFTKWQFLTFNSSLAFRETYWTESLNPPSGQPTSKQVDQSIHREYFTMRTAITGPVFTKIFNTPNSGYAQKFKHVFEPSVTLSHTTNIENSKSIVNNDATDNQIGNSQVTYALSNRFYAKKQIAREILSVSLQQSYNTNQNYADIDSQYSSSSFSGLRRPSHFSDLAFVVHGSPTPKFDTTFNASYNTQAHALSNLTAGGGVTEGWISTQAGWSLTKLIPQAVADPITTASHTLYASTSVRKPGNAFGGTYGFNYDVLNTQFVQQTIVAHYNTQCCGVAVSYQSFNYANRAVAVGTSKDRRFNLSFTLAGIGTFANVFGVFGGQQPR